MDEEEPSRVGPDAAASNDDVSYVSLVETTLSVCSQEDLFDRTLVPDAQGKRRTYIGARLSRLARL